jgi:uncharacterized phage-like protein YoqJ
MFLNISVPSEVTPDLVGRVLVGTGHRPSKLLGYSEEARRRLREFVINWLLALQPRGVISGCALGFDTALAEAALKLNIPFVAAIPFVGQESKWPAGSQEVYRQLLARSAKVIVCSPGGYSPVKMQIRNERMVDIAMRDPQKPGILFALWNGTSSGTKNCIDYARRRQCTTINAWSDFITCQAALA